MWNPFLTGYVAIMTLIYGAQAPVILTPEAHKMCQAILCNEIEHIATLSEQVDKNQKLPDGSSFVEFAIQSGNYKAVTELVKLNFPVNVIDLEKIRWRESLENQPEKHQAACECIDLVEAALQNQGALQTEIAQRNHKKNIQELIAKLKSVNGQLHQAVINNDIMEITKLINEQNADPNCQIGHITPIELAIAHFHPEALKCLLKTERVYATKQHLKQISTRIEVLSACQPAVINPSLKYNSKFDVLFQSHKEKDQIYRDAEEIKTILQTNHQLINQILDNEKFY